MKGYLQEYPVQLIVKGPLYIGNGLDWKKKGFCTGS